MPKRREACFEDLPEEIVVDHILIRLPSKAVGRCRVVCKSWLSATSTPRFMLEHHRRQPSLPIIDGDGQPATFVVFGGTSAGASNQQLWPFLRGNKHFWVIRLQDTCDGFIIVSHRSLVYYIYNPVIHQRVLLPQPRAGQSVFNNVIGFYRHHPTREYRVPWVSRSQYLSEFGLYYIHTVGANEPRHVRVRMPTVSSPSVEQKLLNELSYLTIYPPPVHHRGSLHRCPNGSNSVSDTTRGRGGNIVLFDTEAESFRWICSPSQPCASRKLFNMKGALALCGCSSAVINVWVMQDYKAKIWAFNYRIGLSAVEVSRQLYSTSLKTKKETPLLDSAVEEFNDMAVLNERELLIKFNKKYVLRCDIDGKFLGMVNIGKSQYCMMLTQHRLQETIIPIPSHEMQ